MTMLSIYCECAVSIPRPNPLKYPRNVPINAAKTITGATVRTAIRLRGSKIRMSAINEEKTTIRTAAVTLTIKSMKNAARKAFLALLYCSRFTLYRIIADMAPVMLYDVNSVIRRKISKAGANNPTPASPIVFDSGIRIINKIA